MSDETLKKMALDYHRYPTPGKIEITPTKPLSNQRDLALAYSPGVAAACEAIVKDPSEAASLTSRQNLVAVITNGSAVLGLGNIGPLAAKPVMEGKGVLFKKFAGINVFDIELNETDPDKLVDIICALEPTFGAINLEDIKAPDCFYVEKYLHEHMSIPVFHDDQHGTAIVVAAAMKSALEAVGKESLPGVLIAYKMELRERLVVQRSQGEQMAQSLGMQLFETSALDGADIEAPFLHLAALIAEAGIEGPELGSRTGGASRMGGGAEAQPQMMGHGRMEGLVNSGQ